MQIVGSQPLVAPGSRRGGVYIAVLGTSLIVSLLALSALMAQRIQNRQFSDSADVRQAELNAGTAVDLALLTMKQNANWRTTQPHGSWFTGRGTDAGTCSVDVIDPIDSNLANSADDAVVVRGIGYSGRAEQRVEVTVDPRKQPLASLRSAVAAGDTIDLQTDILRTSGLVTANQTTATASQVYGTVEAIGISGSTYSGTTTQVNASKRPAMPDWVTVFDYYRTNGTQLNYNSLATATPNLGRNVGFENGTTDWFGFPNSNDVDLEQKMLPKRSGLYSMEVKGRDEWWMGAGQQINSFVKPNQQYLIEVWLSHDYGSSTPYCLTLVTKGTGGSAQQAVGPPITVPSGLFFWTRVSATLTAPSWTGNLEYAFVLIAPTASANEKEFFLDDFVIRENTTGRLIYRKVLGPGVNNLYGGAPTNAQGLYWINCNGNRLTIERSRILGTLLIVNPGANSCVDGPISWSPAASGYPALLVDADNAGDADFTIKATNRMLSETENGVNFIPAGAVHDEFGQDTDTDDIYCSEIRGLVAIEDDLTYSNRSLIRGQILVGDDIANSSGELEVEYQPYSLLNPPPGFFAPYAYQRRPDSTRKVVLP